MTRTDLYSTVHKGLRAALFAAAELAARTDFASSRDAALATAAVRRVLGFLSEHAAHEDDAILPELAAIAPELHADLRSEHARVEGSQVELERLLARLDGATGTERVSLGRRVQERLGLLVAAHLAHMAREESEANRALWAHRSDEELRAVEGRILAAVPAARLAEWMTLILPAADPREREELLAGMRAAVTADVYAALTGPALAAIAERGGERVSA